MTDPGPAETPEFPAGAAAAGHHSRRPFDPLERLRRLNKKDNGHHAAPKRSGRNGRRWPFRTLVIANVATVLALVIAGGSYAYVEWRLGQFKHVKVAGLQEVGRGDQSKAIPGSHIAPFTLLVIGSDTRNLGSGDKAQFGSGAAVAGQRSDSIILVRVNPASRKLGILSIPRDTLVPVPGYGTTRINAAFDAGTPSLLVTVLKQDFNIEVNHVLEFNFNTFQQIADAVGGVEQYFPTPAKDTFSSLNIPQAGCYDLKGLQALGFVRSREYEYYLDGEWHYQLSPESDLARIQRQQSFARELIKKARKIAPTNILELNSILSSLTKNLTLDSTFSSSLILKLAQDFRSADLSTIPSYTYPTQNSTVVPGALDPDETEGKSVIQEWLSVGTTPAPTTTTTSTTTMQTAAPSTSATTLVAPTSVRVEVMNGSGIRNQAGTAGSDLSALGYNVTVSGDVPSFGVTTTEVEYAPDALNAAMQLSHEIVGGATLVEDSSLTPTPYNVALVTGTSYEGVTAASSTPTSSSSSSTSSTTSTTVADPLYDGSAAVNPDSSSIYHGVYIPPGLEPGQTPQTCGE